jgi:hypothetical protein
MATLHFGYGQHGKQKSGAAVGTALTSATANVATLVADGASPTQAHVTTLNTNYAVVAAALAYDIVVLVDTKVTRSQLRARFNEILAETAGQGLAA